MRQRETGETERDTCDRETGERERESERERERARERETRATERQVDLERTTDELCG